MQVDPEIKSFWEEAFANVTGADPNATTTFYTSVSGWCGAQQFRQKGFVATATPYFAAAVYLGGFETCAGWNIRLASSDCHVVRVSIKFGSPHK